MLVRSMDIGLDRLTKFLEDPLTGHKGSDGDGARVRPRFHPRLTAGDCLEIYRIMVLSRQLDHRELTLQKQMQAWFSIFCAGKEAVLAAAGKALRPTDPIWSYYRDRALCLMRGMTAREMLLQAVAAREDPSSSGRQMADHWGHVEKAIVIQASPTGAQCVPAVGLAEAVAKTSTLLKEGGRFPADAVVYTSLGDGTTAEGEFYEAVRAAILSRAPVIIHLEDDGYGISVPVTEQVPGGDLMALFRGWPNLRCMDIDGCDVRGSYDAFVEAASWCRAQRGPVLIRSRVLRLMSHSSTDDMRKYRTAAEIAIDFERDPIPRFAHELVAYGVATPDELLRINREVEAEVVAAAEDVTRRPKTDAQNIASWAFRWDPPTAKARYAAAVRDRRADAAGKKLLLADALSAVLHELMEIEPRIVMWGEDVADLSREYLRRHAELKGKGGVFGITHGLQRRFGPDRVANAPIAEASIVGRAIGHALQGFLPVVEIQFRDYLNPAWQQLVDQAATMSWRSGGRFACPMVIRMSYGGYLGGAGAVWHSEAACGPLLHHPGLRVCVPSNARDAAGLMRAAVFSGEIVLYMEPKARYRRPCEYAPEEYPAFDEVLWPGMSRTYGDGKDLAILTYGNTAAHAWDALKNLAREGIRGRMVDLPWLSPLDEEAIKAAADVCGRVLIVDEDRRTCGAGAAIADVLYRDRGLRRRVDVERLAAKDCRVSYGPIGERAVLPHAEDIIEAARTLLS
ncbi:MAG: dehydrogenase [Planctomycetes bacterium]|nr:dehydrogenase [Planctomycetota bacterium]